jgi:serine/threonine-protein kinase
MSSENHSVEPSRQAVTASEDASDVEVARVLESYLAAVEAGQPADPELLMKEHPSLANQLRACLRVLHVAENAAHDLTGAPQATRTAPRKSDAALPHQSGAGFSSMSTLDFGPGEPPHVMLREPANEGEPMLKLRTDGTLASGANAGRFQLQGEIARGGMGAVLKGRDVDLGRDLAIKVMLESHRGNVDVVRRFVEEAQIGGQLQHPGVVPVYELGTFPDERPYFAMKLVKGRTLASLLQERADPTDDLPRFLGIFEQVCQTMAYAHARGVIHRDLKPSNIMVGSFGEVQVMDWGLAKVLPQGGIADEPGGQPGQETVIMTLRSGSSGGGSESQAGSVLGTPAYMAPEQARGEIERVDERADVFGLGAMLCEILTGKPPFVATSRDEIRAQAARADLSHALGRLQTCGADNELIELTRNCLSPERDCRPRNAGEVAARITAHLAGVQDRLRQSELARVEAQTRAAEERKRRRVTVALAASILATASVGAGGWTYLSRQHERRATQVDLALREAEVLRDEAVRGGNDLVRWATARGAAASAARLAVDARDELTRSEIRKLVDTVDESARTAVDDQRLVSALSGIRSGIVDDPDGSLTDGAYADAFRTAYIDVDVQEPEAIAAKVTSRPGPIALALIMALDDWATVRRRLRSNEPGARRLVKVACAMDADSWRNKLREAVQEAASHEKLNTLKRVASTTPLDDLPALSLFMLGTELCACGDAKVGTGVLRVGQRRYPGDYWLNLSLARSLRREGGKEEAVRYLVACRSLRPELGHELAHELEKAGEIDEAIAVMRDPARARSPVPRDLVCLGRLLQGRGREDEAKAALDEAFGSLLELIRRNPASARYHVDIGLCLDSQRRLLEAVDHYREAIRLKPGLYAAHMNLGADLCELGKHTEAILECREAVRLMPNLRDAHYNLAQVLLKQGSLSDAIGEFRSSIRLDPGDYASHCDLGVALLNQGSLQEASSEFHHALRLRPSDAESHNGLGLVLQAWGKREGAVIEFEAAIRLKPDLAEAHGNLGLELQAQGLPAAAAVEFRKALDLAQPASALRTEFEHALRAAERDSKLLPRLTSLLQRKEPLKDAAEGLAVASLCLSLKRCATAATFFANAFRSEPGLAEDMNLKPRYNAACAAALAAGGQGKDEPPLDEAAKIRWRKQAVEWLTADLAAWATIVEKGSPQERQSVAPILQHWKTDPDLAGLRDQSSIATLPDPERKACNALWAQVDALLAKPHGGITP